MGRAMTVENEAISRVHELQNCVVEDLEYKAMNRSQEETQFLQLGSGVRRTHGRVPLLGHGI